MKNQDQLSKIITNRYKPLFINNKLELRNIVAFQVNEFVKLNRKFHCNICHQNDCSIDEECRKDSQVSNLFSENSQNKSNNKSTDTHHQLVLEDSNPGCDQCVKIINDLKQLRDQSITDINTNDFKKLMRCTRSSQFDQNHELLRDFIQMCEQGFDSIDKMKWYSNQDQLSNDQLILYYQILDKEELHKQHNNIKYDIQNLESLKETLIFKWNIEATKQNHRISEEYIHNFLKLYKIGLEDQFDYHFFSYLSDNNQDIEYLNLQLKKSTIDLTIDSWFSIKIKIMQSIINNQLQKDQEITILNKYDLLYLNLNRDKLRSYLIKILSYLVKQNSQDFSISTILDKICEETQIELQPTQHLRFFWCQTNIINIQDQNIDDQKEKTKTYFDIIESIFNDKNIKLQNQYENKSLFSSVLLALIVLTQIQNFNTKWFEKTAKLSCVPINQIENQIDSYSGNYQNAFMEHFYNLYAIDYKQQLDLTQTGCQIIALPFECIEQLVVLGFFVTKHFNQQQGINDQEEFMQIKEDNQHIKNLNLIYSTQNDLHAHRIKFQFELARKEDFFKKIKFQVQRLDIEIVGKDKCY